jgi:hypothetical protein
MKLLFRKAVVVALGLVTSLGFAQTQINLQLNHTYNDQAIVYGESYVDAQNRAVEFSRSRYYLSSFEVVHDGGQVTSLDDVYVLAHANISSYDLGSYNIESVERLRFNVGVDYDANHDNSSNYTSSHPLGPQSPLMDWGWPSGYFFFDLNGAADGNDNGTANSNFEFRGFGDNLLRSVELNYSASVASGIINLPTQVSLDRWIGQQDLVQIGINHGSTPAHSTYMNNINSNSVFTTGAAASISLEIPSYIYVDYSMPYAPVLNYQLPQNQSYSLYVYDVSGRLMFKEDNLGYQGNYFILKELNSGAYIANFVGQNHSQSKRFIVNK